MKSTRYRFRAPEAATCAAFLLPMLLLLGNSVYAQADTPVAFNQLPANQWMLIHSENSDRGKRFSKAVYAPNVDRVYLWGTGGRRPARNVFQHYELDQFEFTTRAWSAAFPASKVGAWTENEYPPFRILGQTGPDGLRYDEGPRLQVVGGYNQINRIRWFDFDGEQRPSPIHTFNMAAWDSQRNRIIYYSDSQTFSLDPETNSWTDLKARNHPTTCQHVAWAHMAYDAGNDRVMLFGGGHGTNPDGGASTWFYDCATNQWKQPKLETEPPLRCNGAMVYEPSTKQIFLFGGYNQSAALNDTWVYDCVKNAWQLRKPKRAPPPMYDPASALLPHGKVLVCGNDARKVRRHHLSRTSASKETWVCDVAKNTWTPINADLNLAGYQWLTATAVPKQGIALLTAFGPRRQTFALRYDAGVEPLKLTGAAPDSIAWKYPEQKLSLEQAPAPEPDKHAAFLASIPSNEMINANPPGMLISKTWSTAVLDTDRGEIVYTGGGHSGYSGNDMARYSIAENRWSLDMPPRFPPYLEGTNAGLFGWSYGMMPYSQHTYLWYCYDPVSKAVLYLARPSIHDGIEVQLKPGGDVMVYNENKHQYQNWVYDSAAKVMRTPSFGRPFQNQWHLSLVGTPRGVFAAVNRKLYHATVNRESGAVKWRIVDPRFPKPRQAIEYHYEFQPVVYDSTRNRLIQLKGDKQRVDVFTRSLDDDGQWSQVETTGNAAIGREAVYIPRHDTIVWLGDRLFAYNCATKAMGELDVKLPEGSYTHECALIYDEKHDVCIALIPSSFSAPMQTFLYRFDPQVK